MHRHDVIFIYLPLSIIHYFQEGTSLLSAIKLFIVGFVFVGEQYNAWILWYLLSAVYALIVIIIINRTRITHKKLCVTILIALVLSTMLAYLSAYDGDLNGFLEVAKRLDIVVFSKGRILRGLIYLPLGIIFSYHHLSKKLGITLFLICTGIRLLVYSEIIETFLILCSAAGLFTMVKSISLKDNQIYRCFRSMSSSIYYIHLYVWTLAYMILYGSKTYGFKIFMITAVTSGTIAFLYWYFSKQKHCAK